MVVTSKPETERTMSSAIKLALVPTMSDIPPQSVAAAASASSGWVDASTAPNFIARANLGALGGGTVTLSFEQATSSGGAGAKALAGGAASAVNNANIEADLEAGTLDHANGFTYFRAKLANVGGTGALVSALVEAGSPRYAS